MIYITSLETSVICRYENGRLLQLDEITDSRKITA